MTEPNPLAHALSLRPLLPTPTLFVVGVNGVVLSEGIGSSWCGGALCPTHSIIIPDDDTAAGFHSTQQSGPNFLLRLTYWTDEGALAAGNQAALRRSCRSRAGAIGIQVHHMGPQAAKPKYGRAAACRRLATSPRPSPLSLPSLACSSW